jgi:hypothetical protein
MTFADPRLCLSCRGSIDEGIAVCPHCGMNLGSTEIQQAWRALVVADQWVARAKGIASSPGSPSAAATRPPEVGDRVGGEAVVSRSRLSAGTVLLVLGAVALLVAGLIFITVSWGSLGIIGRALALLAFTAVVGGLAYALTRRGLRASAEALWTVFLGLLTLDWFAARDQGLFGLDALPGGYATGIWGAVVLVAGIAIARAGQRPLGRTLIAPTIAAGAAPLFGAGGVAGELIDDDVFWWALATGLVAAVVTMLHRRLNLRPAVIVATAGTAILATIAVIAALVEALDHPSLHALMSERHGLPLVIVTVGAVLVGVGTRDRARSIAASVAALAAGTLVATPADAAWAMRGAFVVGAVVAVACAAFGAGHGAWRRGLRWASAIAATLIALGDGWWLGRLIEVAAAGAVGERTTALGHHIALGPHVDVGPWWVPLVIALGVSGALLSARRWPELAPHREASVHLTGAAATVLALGAATAVAIPIPPAVSLGSSLVVIGAFLTFVNRAAPPIWRHLGSAVVAIAPVVTLSSWPASLVVWPLAALALALSGWRESDADIRWAERGFAAWWVSLVPGIAVAYAGRPARMVALAIIAGAVVVLITSALRDRDGRSVGAPDLGAGAALAIGLILGTVPGLDAVPWTVAGVGVTVAGLVNRQRRWCHVVGPALLGIAYIVRLAESRVDVIEAYTAPFAVGLLGVGLWALRKQGIGTVRAIGPGVTLALLPSLPQAQDEPTSLRALLLGLVAVAFLAIGLSRRWQAPFVGGTIVTLLLVIANIGPWAMALPRWVLFAALGALAIGIGATWESRVRNGRAVTSYVSGMR